MKLKHEKCITSCNKLNKFHMQRHKIKFHKYICNTQTVLYLIIKNILKDFFKWKSYISFLEQGGKEVLLYNIKRPSIFGSE